VDDVEENALLAAIEDDGAGEDDVEAGVAPSEDVEIPVEDDGVERGDEVEKVTGGGLRPPAPSSVDPMGMPTRPTGPPAAIPVGEEADAVGRAEAVLPAGAQVPDAVPVLPPSKTVVNPVEGVVELVAEDVPVVGAPKEASGIEPPKPEQTAMSLVERPEGVAPGDVPGGTSSVAPRGIPVGETAAAGPTPSGEVMPSGEGPGAPPTTLIWATAEPEHRTTASIAVMKNRVILVAPACSWRRNQPRELSS
jgi:hypothetical protein